MFNTPKGFAASTTTVIDVGNVTVHTVVIPKTSAGTITLEDSAGNDYFVFPASTVAGSYIFDSNFPSGLSVVTSGADVGVINYSK